jgi:8-oxo-dGTP pyrophosphatase MutT (NUDIX family)
LRLLKEIPKNILVFIICENEEITLSNFFKNHDFIEAAWGIVKRKDKYLVIKRNDVWDLPKGKIEHFENPEITALREIEEECGIQCDRVEKLIYITYHTYQFHRKNVLKKTYWFAINYFGKKKVKPQKEEKITIVKWVNSARLNCIQKKTFPSLKDVINFYVLDITD